MYHYSYAEIMADSPADARAQERRALDHAVTLLRRAGGDPPSPTAEQEALGFTTQLWNLFIKDLARPDNDLPAAVRASLISVGLGIMGETQRITLGESRDFAGIAEICGIIRDGLV